MAAPVPDQVLVVDPCRMGVHLAALRQLDVVECVVTFVADSRTEFMPLEIYAAQILIAVIH